MNHPNQRGEEVIFYAKKHAVSCLRGIADGDAGSSISGNERAARTSQHADALNQRNGSPLLCEL